MHLLARIMPKAERFRDFTPADGALPKHAVPFIWVFVRALALPLGLQALGYALRQRRVSRSSLTSSGASSES